MFKVEPFMLDESNYIRDIDQIREIKSDKSERFI